MRIFTFEQYIARFVVKNGHQNDTCYMEIIYNMGQYWYMLTRTKITVV
jgi:hypothetical protein